MKNWKTRISRVSLSAVALATIIGLLSSIPPSVASAAPVPAPQVTVSKKTPVSSHCAKKARWKKYMTTDTYKDIKVRIWYYNDGAYFASRFCVTVDKKKPKRNKTKLGLYASYYDEPGVVRMTYTKGAKFYQRFTVPTGFMTMVKPVYGKKKYKKWYGLVGTA